MNDGFAEAHRIQLMGFTWVFSLLICLLHSAEPSLLKHPVRFMRTLR